MPHIHVETLIQAPMDRCFDLARDIMAHEKTTASSNERVIGVLRGGTPCDVQFLELGDEVTFEAKHFGVRQRLTSKVVAYDRPNEFTDEMQRGAFKAMRHIHRFEAVDDGTKMIDTVDFTSPAWIFGKIADAVFLTRYMRKFMASRGLALKQMAESR